ncbi:LRP5-like protein, partial [Mya arenaria]
CLKLQRVDMNGSENASTGVKELRRMGKRAYERAAEHRKALPFSGRCSESYVCRKLPTNRTCDVQCIPKSQRCDGSPQCPLQDDEETCPTKCQSGSFLCPSGKCAPICDGQAQCDGPGDNNDDERNCTCMTGQTRCPNGTCVTPCNETPECNNGDDEAIYRLLCFGDLCRLATNDAECTAYSDKVALCKGGQNGMCDPLTGLVRRSQGGDVF